METKWKILGLLIVVACAAGRKHKRFSYFRELTGWQKAFGILALVAAVVIMLNPEFICLGLVGDATFFDLLVLALSLQMHGIAKELWRILTRACVRMLRRLNIPSPGLLYLMCALTFAVPAVSSVIHKMLIRIS